MIVVTGASGFIGSNLVCELNRRGDASILAVDDYFWLRGLLEPTRRFAGIRYGGQMRVAGFLDMHDLSEWLDRDGSAVSAIIHLGACSNTMETDREWIMAVNLEYSQVLWNWCTKARRPFLYASSAATYGDGSSGYNDRCDPSAYAPLNLYGESKHLFDLWALRQSKTPPRWVGLKYFNVYGPNEYHKGRMASVVYHGFLQIEQSGRLHLLKSYRADIPDGQQARDFVFVADAVSATLHFLDTTVSDSAPNGLYNVGVGQARTFFDLGCAIFSALRRRPRILYVPMPEHLQSRYQYFTQAMTGKLRAAGFLDPMLPLEEGVRRYIQGYLVREARAA